ncbi:MAG: lipopolysaccharide transport periplasmic protein LptA [Mariprofundaceae bacterium]
MMIRILSLAGILLAASMAHAGPLHIESRHMLLDHKMSQVEFAGQVLLTRDDFQLQCDKLIAHYIEGRQKLEKAEAYGHVRMQQGNAHGEANEALLDQGKGTLILMGDAFIEQNGSRIEGQTITHNMNQQRTTVIPDEHGRTRMILESTDEPSPAPDKAP